MRWFTGSTIGALCLVSLLAAGVARAADVEDPEALIQQAVELRRKGDNARAYGYLKRAYDIARTPRSAAQLGLVEHALGRYADAEVHLGEALATSDPWVGENRARLESSRNFVRSKLGRVEILGAPGDATVSVGTDPAIKVPPDRVLYLAPGERTLRVEGPGLASVTKTVAVNVGKTATITVEASKETGAPPSPGAGAATAAAAPSGASPAAESSGTGGPGQSADARPGVLPPPAAGPDRSSGRGLRIAGLGIAGGGLALGVAGIFVRGAATSKLDAIASDAKNHVPYDESNGNWQGLDRAGVAMIVTGGVAVVAGTVLYLVNRTSSESSSSNMALAFVPAIGGGGALTFAGRY
jgi:hypothetical protein